MNCNTVNGAVIDAAIQVHRALGPGLLENAYEACLEHELKKRGYDVKTQLVLPLVYDGLQVDGGYRIDMLVNDAVIVELKAVEKVLPVQEAQLLSYLKLSGRKIGLLLNFNVQLMRDGITRRVLQSCHMEWKN